MTISVHDIAQAGFGEGTNELYDRSELVTITLRPSDALVQSKAVLSAVCLERNSIRYHFIPSLQRARVSDP